MRVERDGRAHVGGSVSDFDQKQQVENIARSVSGVRSVASDLTVPKGWMGVTVNSAAGGALVQFVMPTGPAGRAGITPNDVIVAIDGRPISDQAGFHAAISTTAAGQTVMVALLRAAQSYRVAVKLRKNPFRRR